MLEWGNGGAPKDRGNLKRVGLAQHEEAKGTDAGRVARDTAVDVLTRTAPRIEQLLHDILKGLLRRDNYVNGEEFSTASGQKVADAQGIEFTAARITGGYPLSSFTIAAVGGGTMQASVNGSPWMPVAAGDVFGQIPMEIWSLRLRVTTAASGTARVFYTAYIPGVEVKV